MTILHTKRLAAAVVALWGLGAVGVVKADICQVDDVIIDGSLNVGIDSVCNRSFGFDTIILSENNLRILFEDTSSSASFPSNDWRLTANDSTNGGLNHFSIDDATAGRSGVFRIEAGARSSSLYVDSSSRVGLKTNNPVVELHIADGDSPTVRLEQDGTSGFTPQTWDMAGNETNFFIRDVTNGSKLPFRIRPGALTSSIDIDGDGNVGIGNSSPDVKLDVISPSADDRAAEFAQEKGPGDVLVGIENTASPGTNRGAGFEMRLQTSAQTRTAARMIAAFNNTADATRTSEFQFWNNNSGAFAERLTLQGDTLFMNRGSIAAGDTIQVGTDATNGNGARLTDAGVWTAGSSRDHKDKIIGLDAQSAVDAVKLLEPVTYVGKEDTSGEHYVGFIAEDVPELVAMNDRKGIAAIEVVAVVTKVVQEQQKTIEQQQQTIAELADRIKQLEAR